MMRATVKHKLTRMPIDLRPVEARDIDDIVALALRAWEPVHMSMAAVLGERLNSLVYPDWAASQEADVRSACTDPDMHVSVAIDAQEVLGFVAVAIHTSGATGEVDMIAVDPAAHRRGIARALTEAALTQMRHAGCSLAVVATGGDDGHAPARALYESVGFAPLPLVRYYRQL